MDKLEERRIIARRWIKFVAFYLTFFIGFFVCSLLVESTDIIDTMLNIFIILLLVFAMVIHAVMPSPSEIEHNKKLKKIYQLLQLG